jgi:uncharacterized protein
MIQLDEVEARLMGCLMEKAVTTPDVYPLTVNSLIAASNQTTNRFPVVHYDEHDVQEGLRTLREKGLTRVVHSTSNRAAKHRHVLDDVLSLSPGESAVICVLLLRGPQTVGEVKGRTERLHGFADLAEAESTLDALGARDEPLVVRLPRQPGQKDVRYAHLLSGPVDVSAITEPVRAPAASPRNDALAERMTQLETEFAERVSALEREVAELRQIVERLRPLLD